MRRGVVWAAAAVVWLQVDGVGAREVNADTLLEACRVALGGSDALDAVRALRAEGRSARVIGPLKVGGAVTLELERPDRYLRTDRLSIGGVVGQTALGYRGEALIQRSSGDRTAAAPGQPDTEEQGRMAAKGLRRELRFMLLGFFAGAVDRSIRAVELLGTAEAPDGRADAIRITFEDDSVVTFYIDAVTHLPLMVGWEAPDALSTVAARSGNALSAPVQTNHRFYFADYRRVGNLRWPFLIRRASAGEVREELKLEKIIANPAFNPGTFAER